MARPRGNRYAHYTELNNGSLRKKRGFVPFEYSLAVVDEFQNYLPEQLGFIKSCINKQNQSILYVGDIAQQVLLGTIRDWNQINENVSTERSVVLQKVYRNTKNILRYIQGLGYSIEVPNGIKEGSDVIEYISTNIQDEISFIEESINEKDYSSIGILSKDSSYLPEFSVAFSGNDKIHVMTMNESQGVEFDFVFIVGVNNAMFRSSFDENIKKELTQERKRINKDLLYVALTRAISELYILGRKKLRDFI